MSGLLTSFNAGVSGLQSAQTSLNTTAHNLANATTKGYTRQQTIIADSFYKNAFGSHGNPIQVGMGTTIVNTRQIRNSFLDDQYRMQVGKQSFYEANYSAVGELEELFGEMEGEEFVQSLNDLWVAVDNLSKEPDNIVYRSALVSQAGQFADRASILRQELVNYQNNMNQEVLAQVKDINDIVSKIRDTNILIRKYEAAGNNANDYRDERNILLDKLGTYIDFDVTEEIDGTISILSEGDYLLSSETQFKLSTAYESEESRLLKPVRASGGDFFIRGELNYSAENNSDIGSLKGILVARGNREGIFTDMPQRPKRTDFMDATGNLDTAAYNRALEDYGNEVGIYSSTVAPSVIMRTEAQFDQLVHEVVTLINDKLCPNKTLTLEDGSTIQVLDEENAPIGDDADKSIGIELFTRRNVDRYEKVTVNAINDEGLLQTMEVYKYNEEDYNDIHTLYTASQIEVNPELEKDPSKLPLNANPKTGFVDGFVSHICKSLMDEWHSGELSLDPTSLATYSFSNYYNSMIGEFATQGNVWNGIIENQEVTVKAVEDQRQDIMGVSSDEELASLLKYQQCYNASSRYITVIDQMLEHLIERL
ncbi:flagellar hook-associated protein FlgK [Eubacterium xylanophilum]|uniref:flagellar hook-associated protein FlgK n=1 Tax=Eubacterium xylanophilum TaxID=39497 RepID=UPI00047BE28C|nr:flagellar hook-associated protein FlgK [Eubacterium xylanophilum]